jgi:hypothetical protein
VAWHISSGEVNFQTVRKNVEGSSTEVSTPTVKATAGELAQGGIKVAEAGDTDVKLYRGSAVAETRAGQRVDISANEGVTVDAAGKAGPKVSLPVVPTLLAPPHQAEISYPDLARATTLLAWKPVAGAAAYHVMVDYSPYFNRPLVDRTGWRESSMELRGLDVGKYYWRVAAVDKDAVEGNYSDFARFTVGRPTGAGRGEGPPPALLVEPLDVRQNIVQVKAGPSRGPPSPLTGSGWTWPATGSSTSSSAWRRWAGRRSSSGPRGSTEACARRGVPWWWRSRPCRRCAWPCSAGPP